MHAIYVEACLATTGQQSDSLAACFQIDGSHSLEAGPPPSELQSWIGCRRYDA